MRLTSVTIVVSTFMFLVIATSHADENACDTSSFTKRVLAASAGTKDPLLGEDKVHHLLTSAFLAAAGYFVAHEEAKWSDDKATAFAAAFSFSFGLGKEVYDKKSKNGHCSFADLVADICGIAVGILVFAGSS